MLEIITTALIAGAAAGVGGVATQAITETYTSLKNFIVAKFTKLRTAIELLEEDPQDENAQKSVIKRLDEAKVSDDPQVQQLAAALAEALKTSGLLPTNPSVNQKATGMGNIQVGGNAGDIQSNVSTGNKGVNVQGSNVGKIVYGDEIGRDKIGTQINNFSTAPELKSINTEDARALVPLLNEYFALNDIDSLCFEMGIDEEQLRGQTKDEKTRSLVKFVEQNERLPELKRLMRMARPNLRNRLS